MIIAPLLGFFFVFLQSISSFCWVVTAVTTASRGGHERLPWFFWAVLSDVGRLSRDVDDVVQLRLLFHCFRLASDEIRPEQRTTLASVRRPQ